MTQAATVSSFRVLRIRPAGCAGSSVGSPSTWLITATPVSKPDMPSASLGKSVRETATIRAGLPCSAVRAVVQSVTRCASWTMWAAETAMTTAFRAR